MIMKKIFKFIGLGSYILVILVVIGGSAVGTYFLMDKNNSCGVKNNGESVDGVQTSLSKVVRQTEPLLLTGNDVLTIEDTEYILGEKITARGDSKIIIKNSRLVQDQGYVTDNHIQLFDNASMEISDTFVNTSRYITWGFNDYSTYKATNISSPFFSAPYMNFIDHAQGTFRNANFGGTLGGHARIDIEGGTKHAVEMTFPKGAVIDEEFPKVAEQYLFPGDNDHPIYFQISIKNASVSHWAVGFETDSDITIRNSDELNITHAVNRTPGIEIVEFNDLKGKHYEDSVWELGNGSFRLVNSNVSQWSPVSGAGTVMSIRDSFMSDIQFSTGDAKIYIYDSVNSLLVASEDVYMRVEDSLVEGDVIARDNGVIELINTRVRGEIIEEGNGKVIVESL